MEYHKIISVTGLGGLFELVGSKSDGAIVRSLEDKTTRFVSSRVHNFSHIWKALKFLQNRTMQILWMYCRQWKKAMKNCRMKKMLRQ